MPGGPSTGVSPTPHPDTQLPLPILSTCPVCLGNSHSQALWGICNEDRELAPDRPGPSLWVEHPSQGWKLWVGGCITHWVPNTLHSSLTVVTMALEAWSSRPICSYVIWCAVSAPHHHVLPIPAPLSGHTHTAQKDPGCYLGSPAPSVSSAWQMSPAFTCSSSVVQALGFFPQGIQMS